MKTTSLLGRFAVGFSIASIAVLALAFGPSRAQLDGLLKRMTQAEASPPSATVASIAPASESVGPDILVGHAVVTDAVVTDAIVTEASAHAVADAVVTEAAVSPVEDTTSPAANVSLTEASVLPATASTGTVQATDGNAIISYPDVEITIGRSATLSEEEAIRASSAPSSIETVPAMEAIASASDQGAGSAQELQHTGLTGGEWDVIALISYPDVEITIAVVAAASLDEAVPSDE